ncbi:MAG: hypothetical protein HOV97_22265 [Nonomuraea sp.]|nr:hypothetical protein [Nonomuraea sp.]
MGAHGFVGVDLFRDRWSCLVAVGNAAGELTIETMAAAPWVVQDTTEDANPVLAALRAQGVEPRIECVVGDFHSIVFLVRDSDRIGLVPSRLAGSW